MKRACLKNGYGTRDYGVNLNTVVRRKRGPIFTRLDDELLAIDAEAGRYYNMSGCGFRIWELIEAPRSIGSICQHIEDELDVEHATCVADVMRFVADLNDLGLVALDSSADASPAAPTKLP